MSLPERAANAGDAVATFAVIGTLAQWLPAVAALCAILWFLIRAYEWGRYRFFGKDSYFKDTQRK